MLGACLKELAEPDAAGMKVSMYSSIGTHTVCCADVSVDTRWIVGSRVGTPNST